MDNAIVHRGQNRVNTLDWRMQGLTLLLPSTLFSRSESHLRKRGPRPNPSENEKDPLLPNDSFLLFCHDFSLFELYPQVFSEDHGDASIPIGGAFFKNVFDSANKKIVILFGELLSSLKSLIFFLKAEYKGRHKRPLKSGRWPLLGTSFGPH
jgi:hypothetical protein